MVPLDRIELPCSDYKTDIMPLYEKGGGVKDGDRTHTAAFTAQRADHYTTNTIEP